MISSYTQGVALSYYIPAFQAAETQRLALLQSEGLKCHSPGQRPGFQPPGDMQPVGLQ